MSDHPYLTWPVFTFRSGRICPFANTHASDKRRRPKRRNKNARGQAGVEHRGKCDEHDHRTRTPTRPVKKTPKHTIARSSRSSRRFGGSRWHSAACSMILQGAI